jgi:two-component system cell cycle response regulator
MQKMAQMATYDELTGLYNRRYFNACLAGEIERCKRFTSGFSLFLTDVDYFKKVNDTDGHPAGDQVLRQAANILKGCLRTSDVPCRFGGDEFIVILPNATDEDCRKICERFRKNLAREEIVWEDQTIHVTVSIGVTSFAGQQADNAQALIQRADEALYRAKKKGRNQVC